MEGFVAKTQISNSSLEDRFDNGNPYDFKKKTKICNLCTAYFNINMYSPDVWSLNVISTSNRIILVVQLTIHLTSGNLRSA